MLDKRSGRRASRLALLSLFLALALIMGLVERWIPFDFAVPGVKLGLANAVVLTALYIFSFADALKIVVLKCAVTALIAGTGLSFLYSLGGALLSFFVMALLIRLGGKAVGPIGVSVVGAVFHNLGQILVASAVMKTLLVVAYLPVLILSGVITGVVVGLLARLSVGFIVRHSHILGIQTSKLGGPSDGAS